MKSFKKLTAALMATTMLFGLTSCAGNSKLGPNKLKAAAKDYGAEEYKDIDDFEDDFESFFDNCNFGDGAYISASGSDLKSAIKSELGDLYYEKSIKDATVFLVNDADYYYFFILNYTFDSEDDAEDFYDDCSFVIDELENLGADSDDGEEDGIVYAVADLDGYDEGFYGVYQSGRNVMVVSGWGDCYEGDIEDLLEDYDIVLPSDL